MSVFGKNDSRRHIFWRFDHHISRTSNEINYRNTWFVEAIIILIMTARVLFFDVFFEKHPHRWVWQNISFSDSKFSPFLHIVKAWWRILLNFHISQTLLQGKRKNTRTAVKYNWKTGKVGLCFITGCFTKTIVMIIIFSSIGLFVHKKIFFRKLVPSAIFSFLILG